MPCLASRVSLISMAWVWWGTMCWANIASASLWAWAAAVVVGAGIALARGVWPAGCSDSLELLQPLEMATNARAPAPIRVIRFHIVIGPFYRSIIPSYPRGVWYT